MIDYEPSLHSLVEDLKAKLKERQLGYFIIAGSRTHIEYAHNPLPPWSCIAEGPGGGVTVNCDEDDAERLRASLHIVLGIGDLLMAFADKYKRNNAELVEQLEKHGVKIDRLLDTDDLLKEQEQ